MDTALEEPYGPLQLGPIRPVSILILMDTALEAEDVLINTRIHLEFQSSF